MKDHHVMETVMNRVCALLLSISCILTLQAQEMKMDKDLQRLVDVVVSLRNSTDSNKKSVKEVLKQNKKWTLMDELKDQNNSECMLTKKMKRFSLVPILIEILTDRYGKNISRGDFLNGEDPKFNYSLIEKGIKAKKKVKYTFQGRVGKQDFVIIPCDPASNLSIKFSKGTSPLKATQQKSKDGSIYLHIDTKLKSTEKITLEIENKSNNNVAVAILNHNTRK